VVKEQEEELAVVGSDDQAPHLESNITAATPVIPVPISTATFNFANK
jgi:hypothetical protein